MGDDTAIQYVDHSWNPFQGCYKLGEECRHCYMYRESVHYGLQPDNIRRSKTTFNAPIKRHRDKSYVWAPGSRILTCSWSDWFLPECDLWRDDAWSMVRARPDLHFMLLTKRPENIATRLPWDWESGAFDHVWLGVSIGIPESRHRLRALQDIAAPHLWASFEPLIEDVTPINLTRVEFAAIGGETGPKARPCQPPHVRNLLHTCALAGVPVWFKSWGAFQPNEDYTALDFIWPNPSHDVVDGKQYHQLPTIMEETDPCKKSAPASTTLPTIAPPNAKP